MTTFPVAEMRVAITVAEYERLVEFYCQGLGIEPAQLWTNEDGSRAVILELGRATLEIFNEKHAASVDQIEVGRRVTGQFRFAFRVPDVDAAVSRLLEHGAVLVSEPVVTPWGHRNARLQAPDGLQITLFEVPTGVDPI
ncbi:MAG: VOC family protein [Chloroflexi bacterium]|nr:VOC family protein [Chloroflexota bacterium]